MTSIRAFFLACLVVVTSTTGAAVLGSPHAMSASTRVRVPPHVQLPDRGSWQPGEAPGSNLEGIGQVFDRVTAYVAAVQAHEAAVAAQAAADAAAAAVVVPQPVTSSSSSSSSGGWTWDNTAQCETGGNWSMQGSTFSGGLGFANSTWDAYGGQAFAPNAGLATREQQITIAEKIQSTPGGCHGW
jgi:Transglycosylase-like domain